MNLLLKAIVLLVALGAAPLATAKPWKGAELLTWQTFRFGAFEARIQAAAGGGIITPFFLIKDDAWLPGQEWQELDFEIFGRSGGTHFQTQIMTPGRDGARVEHIKEVDAQVLLSRAYHTYRIEWTPQYIRFYFDGYLIREETDRTEFAKYFDLNRAEPMRLRASVWGGNTRWTGVFDPNAAPTNTYVRYIAYERYTPGQGARGGDFTPEWKETFSTFDRSRWYLANWDFDYAISEYSTNNANVIDNTLVLSFTKESNQGYNGPVPADTNTPRGPMPRPVATGSAGDGTENDDNTPPVDSNSSSSDRYPRCSSRAVDSDGDGWGWENNRSCRVGS